MQTEGASGAAERRLAAVPTGFRRLTPNLLQADRAAEGFDGLPEGVSVPGQVLAALKAAAPSLGLAPRLVHAIDWLFKFTQPQDWRKGQRPIVWPSASMQQEALGLSETQVKATNRALIDAGLIAMKDSPNGKRYGKRDAEKRIVEAYGFDLSPLAARYAEFLRLAAEAKAIRAETGRLRRRATIARNGITQILETVAEYGLGGDEWTNLARETRQLVLSLRRVEQLEEMALGVAGLERRQRAARERLETLLAAASASFSEGVDSDPKRAENRPHHYTYKPTLYPEQDTVMASKRSKSDAGEDIAQPQTPGGPKDLHRADEEHRADPTSQAARTDRGTVMRLSTDELMVLAPRIRTYLKAPAPTWIDIVDAADWLRGELGVSKSLWGEACQVMGRERAAVAIALVSAKPPEHFRTNAGGYFYGMVAKAKAGELHLERTVWGLRSASSTPRGPASHAGTFWPAH